MAHVCFCSPRKKKMFIHSHLVHEIFTYRLKGWFLILFAASDKLIK